MPPERRLALDDATGAVVALDPVTLAHVLDAHFGAGTRRVLVIVDGDVVERSFVDAELVTPTPPRFERGWRERAACFDVARLDRLRVLTTELRRLLSERAATRATDAEIRLAPRRVLRGESLRRALDWV